MAFSAIRDRVASIGVRSRLSALVFLAVLPLFALLVQGASQDRSLTLTTARAHALDLAHLGADQTLDSFTDARDLLHVLASFMQLASPNWRGCDQMMAKIAVRYPKFSSIGVAAADDHELCHSLPRHHKSFGDPELLQEALRTPAATMLIGRRRHDPATGKPTVFLVKPFLRTQPDGATSAGIVFVGLSIDWQQQIASRISGVDQHTVLIADTRDGTLIAAAPHEQFSGTTSIPRLAASMRDVPHGVLDSADIQNIPRVFGFAALPDFGRFVVAVGISRQAVLADVNSRFATGIGLAVLAAALAIGAAWLLADITQLRPIKALVGTAEQLGSGDLSARAKIHPWQAPEFRALGQTLGAMAEGIAQARHSQSESDKQARLLADNATDMIVRIDEKGRRLYVSPACRGILGYEPAEMLAILAPNSIHPDDREALEAILTPAASGRETRSRRYRLRHRDGHYVWVEGSSRAIPVEPGRAPENIIVVREIEERVAAEQMLKDSEARYRILAENSTDMVFQLDGRMVHRYVSPASRELIGREPEDMVGLAPIAMTHPDDAPLLEDAFRRLLNGELDRASRVSRIRHRDGHWVWLEAEMRAVVDPRSGRPTGIIGASRDISLRKRSEERLAAANRELEAMATQDVLTELVNRRGFDRALETEYRRAFRENAHLGLIMIDVDRFKAFNDLYGHQAGDECLRTVAQAIVGAVRRSHDIAARYGGEELAVILPHTDATNAFQMADRIRHAVRALEIGHAGSDKAIVTVSVGVACLSPQGDVTAAADLVRAADTALYEAKHSGRDRVCTAPEEWQSTPQVMAVAPGSASCRAGGRTIGRAEPPLSATRC